MTTRRAVLLLPLLLAACPGTLECPAGEVDCDGRCAALASDAANCGACGVACGAGLFCDVGACVCAPGTEACGEVCADVASDPAHCGACATTCEADQVCSRSACSAACGEGLTACDRACVDLASDRYHCGGCDAACAPGQSCDAGTCRTLAVACFATNEVRTVSPDFLWKGPVRSAGAGPVSLAVLGDRLWVANSISHSLTSVPVGGGTGAEFLFPGGDDFENVVARGDRLFVSSSGNGNLLVVDPLDGRVVDVIALGPTTVNPRGVAFVGERAYVALYGVDEESGGQAIAAVDLAATDACPAPPCVATLPLLPWADAPGLPFPSHVVVVGSKLYVTLANLKKREGDPAQDPLVGFYVDPAGNGKLAVVDADGGDALSFVDLGPGCLNPGGLAADDLTLWVACGSFATEAILPVDVSGDAPVVGEPVATPSATGGFAFVPGNIAFCAGKGYVTDLWSGDLLRFDPEHPADQAGVAACPAGGAGWAWAADVACVP